jgi:uncharacterized membrane protein (UPF0127 family)
MTLQDILNSNLSDQHKLEIISYLQQGGNTPEQKGETITPTETIIVGDKEYDVAVAATPELRKEGLEPYSYLKDGEGMLFIFDEETTDYFTMENCGIDLDIVFIDSEGEVIQVSSVKAYDSKPVTCEEPYQFVLEVNINSGIEVEDELEQEDDSLSEEEKQFAGEHNKMLVLDANGDVQMKLSGGERIFSRICTRKMIKAAIQAYREDTDLAYRKVGRLVLKELNA